MLIALFSSVAFSQPAPPPAHAQACVACHGPDGNSATPGVPSIAAQPRTYLENTLVLTREGLRGNPVMQGLMKGRTDAEIVAIAKHYSGQKVTAPSGTPDKALQKKGRDLASKLRCASCHDQTFRGKEQMPRLAAQREEFLETRMKALRDQPPPGTDTIMAATLHGVSDADLKALAHYLAQLR